ncbi:MAG: hypothetical protein WBA54_14875 [Acidaminobacteraceae bacterium]
MKISNLWVICNYKVDLLLMKVIQEMTLTSYDLSKISKTLALFPLKYNSSKLIVFSYYYPYLKNLLKLKTL